MATLDISAFLVKQVETRATEFGRRVSTTAGTLHTIAEQLRNDASKHAAADLADRGADIIERIGAYFENSDFDALMSDAEDFSRERPWAVASIGIAAGLVASRILKSTAARRHALAESDFPSSTSDDTADSNMDTGTPSTSRTTRRRKRSKKVAADGA